MTSDWKTAPLSDVCDFQNGFAFKSTDYIDKGQDTWQVFRMGSIERGGGLKQDGNPVFVAKSLSSKIRDYVLNEGDVAIAMTDMKNNMALLAHTAYIPVSGKYVLNQRVGRITVKDRSILDPRFFYYFSNTPEQIDYLRSRANSGVQVNLSTEAIKGSLVLLPPIEKQRAIAHTLGTLDDKIELNRRMNETLEMMAQALFKSWFVDFDPVRARAEGRQPFGMDADTAALFPDAFEDSELGEIPKGWKVEPIRTRAANIQYGLTQSASTIPIGPRFLRITDIQGGKVEWDKVPYCRVASDEFDRYKIVERDILVARTGASTGENIYITSPPEAVFASYLVRFQFADPGEARLVGVFMRTKSYFEYVKESIGGSAQPNASAQVLAGASLVFPSLNIPQRFAELLLPFDMRMSANSQETQTLTALRDILLPKLLSGELRVKEAEKELAEVM